ncbi:hypothetical protein [Bradyrhizobium sp. URHC0002]
MTRDQLNHFREKGITEAKELLWIFAYLWILLGLFAVHKSLVLNEPNLFYHQGFAMINAFVLAKIMFIAEVFNVADDLKRKPLIYPIVYKSAVFSLILISCHLLEDILLGLWHGRSTAESINASELIVFGLIMFIVLMPFFAVKEIARDVGNGKLFEQFFLHRSRYVPLQP